MAIKFISARMHNLNRKGAMDHQFFSSVKCNQASVRRRLGWPWNERNQKLVSIRIWKARRPVCIKTKSTRTSLLLKGLVTKHTTVKWLILQWTLHNLRWTSNTRSWLDWSNVFLSRMGHVPSVSKRGCCKTFRVKISVVYMKMREKTYFHVKVSHRASFWNGGKR